MSRGALGVCLVFSVFRGPGLPRAPSLSCSLRGARAAPPPAYPLVGDQVFLLLALWAFVAPVAWGYSTRFVTVFLGLEPPVRRAAPWLGLGILAIVVFALAQRYFLDGLATTARQG